MKQHHSPKRMCVSCRQMQDKRQLLRVVKAPDGLISIDINEKSPGRGAYLCRNMECLRKAQKSRALERALKVDIEAETYAALLQMIEAEQITNE